MTYKNYVVLSIALTAIIGVAFSIDATAQTTQSQPPHEAISSTVALPSVLLDSYQVLPLLDTRASGNMESLSVTATLPCDSSNNPKVDIIAGELGNTVDVISGSSDYTQHDGPNLTCLFEGEVEQDGNKPDLNLVFLNNTGTSEILLPMGTMVTMTGIVLESGNSTSASCVVGHTDNGDGTCTVTFTPDIDGRIEDNNNNNTCDTGTLSKDNTGSLLGIGTKTSGITDCQRSYVQWDITAIPDIVTIQDVRFKFEINTEEGNQDLDVTPMTSDIASASTTSIWNDVGDGTPYLNAEALSTGTNLVLDLGTSADTDLENALTDNRFAIGLKGDDETATANNRLLMESEEGSSPTPVPTLEVTYQP